jgi:hypothetical protein
MPSASRNTKLSPAVAAEAQAGQRDALNRRLNVSKSLKTGYC